MDRRIGLYLAIFALISLALVNLSFKPAHASAGLMQCMVDCIKTEGKDEKDTCKSRCANVPISADPQNHDCMAIFKQCKKVCESDKECKKVCKDGLMNCV